MTTGDILTLYALEDCAITPIEGHEGGRNEAFICERADGGRYVLRVSRLGDRAYDDYLAEAELVRYLAQNGASVADVLPSVNGRPVEVVDAGGKQAYVSLFEYARGRLISDNGYRYIDGVPLREYFRITGKTLGRIHALSKRYKPVHRRADYFDRFNMQYINRLIPYEYAALKRSIAVRLERFKRLPVNERNYGLVHFDFSDGNYHIDYDTGKLTVFDFDNACYCWYMYDLANLWTHGEGWLRDISDNQKRRAYMNDYFAAIIEGYGSETDIDDAELERLPLFIDMVLIENIVDEFECLRREGESVDYEDIKDAADCLINDIPYAGLFS